MGSTSDIELVRDFLHTDNKIAMGDKLNLKYYENTLKFGAGHARLFGRYQIQAKCSLECRTFRYGTKVDDIATSH